MFISLQPDYLRPNLSLCFCISVSVHQAEARLAAKRAARAEAREIRMRELERQQKEVSIKKTRLMWIHANAFVTLGGVVCNRATPQRQEEFPESCWYCVDRQHFLSNFLLLFRGASAIPWVKGHRM